VSDQVDSKEYLEEVFGDGGLVAGSSPTYRKRSGQITMTEGVHDAIVTDKPLLAEAATGCHAAGQGILMYDGSVKRVEDVVVDDLLMGPDGNPRTVLQLCRGRQEMVDIVPNKGKAWRVNVDHVLTLHATESARRHGFDAVIDVCLRDHAVWSKARKRAYKLYRVAVEPTKREPKIVLKTGFKVAKTGTVEPFFGFSLDGDGRFLLDDFTVTHNTGKSFGYLVPSIRAVTDPSMKRELIARRTVKEGEAAFTGSVETCEESPRVLVVTAGLNLQDQLVSKDLPFLRKILPWPFSFQTAKGRSNFACLSRINATNVFEIEEDDRDQWSEIRAWVGRTKSGDFTELPFEVKPSIRRHVSVSSEECHGSHCSDFRECFAAEARRHAGKAEVVVANFHILLSHLSVAQAGDGTSILPRYDIVILDEVHELPNIARKFLGFHIHDGMLKEPLKLVTGKNKVKADVEREVDAFFDAVTAHRHSGNYKARLRDPGVLPHAPLVDALVRLAEYLQRVANAIGDEDGTPIGDGDRREQNELRRAAAKAKEHAKCVERACLLDDPDRTVYYIAEERVYGRDRYSICGEPIDPAPLLRAMIWEAQEPKPTEEDPKPVKRHLPIAVGTSATLSTKDHGSDADVGFMAARLGAESAKRVVVRTPFDLSKRVLTVYPNESPDPKAKDYAERLAPLIVRAIRASRGRALGLFTSRRALDTVTSIVRREIGDEYPILKQGEAPRARLVDRFRKDVSSCLFGVKSFWAGVDVPGEALSLVFVDKIPFDPPDDPVLDALSAKDDKTFHHHSVPRAALELRQAFGRLIRSENDRGVVILFDRRFTSTGWGKILVNALPSTSVSMNLDDVEKFFAVKG